MTTTFAYDSLGRLTREALQPSLTGVAWSREIEYQDLARRRVERDARGHATTFDLDRIGRVVTEIDPRGFSIETVWDGRNRRQVTDKRGHTTSYDYDALDRVTSMRNALDQVVVTEYQDAENTTELRDRRGIVTRTETDPLGRVRRVLRPWDPVGGTGVAQETNTWDGNGNRTSQTDAEGKRTEFTYDGANRLVRRTDGVGTAAEASVEYRYDGNGNRTSEIDERHTVEAPTVRSSYDALNRLASTTNGEGEATLYDYDAEGNRTSAQEPKGQITTFTYGERGELLTVTQPAPAEGEEPPVTTYGYDPSRNQVSQRDANGALVEMGYDELNRVTSRVQDAAAGGLALLTLLAYDENGNETLRTDPKGQTVMSTYDELDRLETTTYAFAAGETEIPWRHTVAIAYDYDENDNLVQVDESVASGTDPPDRTLTTTRNYDDLDRLDSETNTLPDDATRTVSYVYFDNGTRRSVTDPDGLTTAYTYDGKNRLATTTTGSGTPQARTTTYAYFPDDLLGSVTYPNGVVATHVYDLANRLTSLENTRGGATVSSYAYTYDDNGNRITQVETNGGLTETTTYAYDALNRLASVTYPVDSDYPSGRGVKYAYDAVGNRVGETTTLPGQPDQVLADKRGIFDSLNRLTELEDLLDPAQTESFGWDANGNQTTRTLGGQTTRYVYDVRDKLVEAQQGGGVLGRFQYDFEGRRNLKIGDSGLRQYVYDDTSLFAEYDSVGVQTAKYDYGSDRLLARTHQTEGRQWFTLDGLRSVVNLTDDSGSTVASYHLDAWGNFRFPEELQASRNRFAFTGHLYDPETKLYNAKARYFDPKLGTIPHPGLATSARSTTHPRSIATSTASTIPSSTSTPMATSRCDKPGGWRSPRASGARSARTWPTTLGTSSALGRSAAKTHLSSNTRRVKSLTLSTGAAPRSTVGQAWRSRSPQQRLVVRQRAWRLG